MHTVTVTFDQILHVHRNRSTRTAPRHTVFGFICDGEYTPYVTVSGWPRLEPGMTVRALLRESGDWKSLIGWLDLKTGELTELKPEKHLHRLIFLCCWLVLALMLFTRMATQQQHLQALLCFAFAGMFAAFSRIEYKAWIQAQADLRTLCGLNVAGMT